MPYVLVDAFYFARMTQSQEDSGCVSSFERLCDGLPKAQPGRFFWRIKGRQDKQGQAWLDVHANADVTVVCQRCLTPFVMALQVDRSLGLVESEDVLNALEAQASEAPEHAPEYIVAQGQVDLRGLVEDELILALPYAPRHAQCPSEALSSVDEAARDASSPFSVLKQLKKH